MRIKTYTAPTVAEAMSLIRREMGEDCVIVSTQRGEDGNGARVTAALEETYPEDEQLGGQEYDEAPDDIDIIRQALTYHGVPARLSERMIRYAEALETDNPTMAFAGAMDSIFRFNPLDDTEYDRPVMLIGTPGVGKTITTAKLAARAKLHGHSLDVITTDTHRAGGIEQLAAFTRILKLDLKTADTVDGLRQAVASCNSNGGIIIDSQGTNPFSDAEMDQLDEYIKVTEAEPVLVMAAGGDALEAADIAASFATLGARRMLVTRLDMARRLGAILAAADAARLAFGGVSITPHIADGLSPINPVSLARLIMPDTNDIETTNYLTEAAL